MSSLVYETIASTTNFPSLHPPCHHRHRLLPLRQALVALLHHHRLLQEEARDLQLICLPDLPEAAVVAYVQTKPAVLRP